jgi:peptide/nickel transport system permease protein
MIQGIVVLSAVVVVLVNLVIDLLYGYVNPKARVR